MAGLPDTGIAFSFVVIVFRIANRVSFLIGMKDSSR